jgi:hypothetical protein
MHEQVSPRLQMVLSEVGDGAEVGGVVGRQHLEGDVLVEPLGDVTGRGHYGTSAKDSRTCTPWF